MGFPAIDSELQTICPINGLGVVLLEKHCTIIYLLVMKVHEDSIVSQMVAVANGMCLVMQIYPTTGRGPLQTAGVPPYTLGF